MERLLLDTGPVVGLLMEDDGHHRASVEAVRASSERGRSISTTWEVIGEAYTLIRVRMAPLRSATPALAVLRWAESGIHILSADEADHRRTALLLEDYAQLRLSYVDALLLALAERHRVSEVITSDARHFSAVRLTHRVKITIV